MSKHTPIPWSTDGAYVLPLADQAKAQPGTLFVAMCGISSSYRPPEETKANAEFIVRACNNHDALVATVRDLLPWASEYTKSQRTRLHGKGEFKRIADARSALANATKETP